MQTAGNGDFLTPAQITLSNEALTALEQLDTCTVSNVIEQFGVRTRNEGFVNGTVVRCFFPQLRPRAGYAATARIRTSSTPVAGRCYYERPEWWSYVVSIPEPRFIVVEDVDHVPGLGALFGEIHANICRALSCTAYVTNGAIRDLPGIATTGLQVFAHHAAVSHAYAHVIEFGEPIEIGGLKVKSGDLLHGDQHGVLSIPISIASEIPGRAKELLSGEAGLIAYCRSKNFSLDDLLSKILNSSNKLGHRGH